MVRRQAWREAAEAVKARADQVMDKGAAHDRVAEASMAHLVVALSRCPFPYEDAPAQALAEGFRILARGFVMTTGFERRCRLGEAVVAGADALLTLMDGEAVKASQVWQGQSGGRD